MCQWKSLNYQDYLNCYFHCFLMNSPIFHQDFQKALLISSQVSNLLYLSPILMEILKKSYSFWKIPPVEKPHRSLKDLLSKNYCHLNLNFIFFIETFELFFNDLKYLHFVLYFLSFQLDISNFDFWYCFNTDIIMLRLCRFLLTF